ncbi:MAG: pre-peptidase C-terminal domain-containing protein [Phycisphaerales bacterium]|nr:pre-peptidase C-terminal domain-containing protein [Phycisphaerales bacterium]
MKKCFACGIVALLSANVAMADYVVPGGLLPNNPAVGQIGPGGLQYDLNGAAIPAGTYTGFSVSFDWVAGGGNPWSNEANIFFADADFAGPIGTIHQNGTTATAGAASNGDPTTLSFDGFFAVNYEGGDPLWFLGSQSYTGSTASWSNISVTLTQAAIPTLDDFLTGTLNGPVDSVSGNTLGGGDNLNGPNGIGAGSWSGEDHVYQLNWGGGDINIDLLFSNVDGDVDLILFGDNTGNVVIDSGTSTDDNENINVLGLAAGTYYIAIDGWQGATNAYTLNVTPEPASLALLAMGAAVVIRRRR